MVTTASSPTKPIVDSKEPITPRGLVQRLIFSRLTAFEKLTGVSVDYGRWMANVSLRAFFKYAKLASVAQYRRVLPANAYHVAHIVAARDEDCGTCVQIGINLAKRAGIPVSVLRATLDRKPEDLPAKLADVYRFVESVVTLADDDALRQRVRAHYGDEGLIELAIAIAASRTFPVVKRTLGYAKSCSIVPITLE
jgi:alkylhydroperoxidase family enzyme